MSPASTSTYRPMKRRRRTATAVLAGDFEPRPCRDVLTSLLNGVPPYPELENRGWEKKRKADVLTDETTGQGAAKKKRGRPRKVRRPESTPTMPPAVAALAPAPAPVATLPPPLSPTPMRSVAPAPFDISVFGSRTVIHVLSQNRARSLTPPPMPSSPPTTPGPSISSSVSLVSSKRLHTPDDYPDLQSPTSPQPPRERKRRPSARKGWKGWVEVSDDEEDTSKRIKLDDPVPVTEEKRLRSGRAR